MTIPSSKRGAALLRRAGWVGALALPALLGAAGSCSAASYVVQNTADSGAGSLRDAITQAQAGADASDTITFAPNVTGTIALGGTEIAIGKSVSIAGPGAKALALDAGGTSRVFNISAGTVSLSGLTLKNGHATDGGGLSNAGALTVTACAFSGDSATSEGGGFYNASGTATITSSTFSGDSATHGGGLFNIAGTVSVTDSTFSGNAASSDGSAVVNFSTLAITSSTFSANTSSGGQGTVANYSALTVTATLFAGSGGGDFGSFFGGAPRGTVTSGGSNLLGDPDGNGFVNGTKHDQTGVADAVLGPLADYGGPTQTCALQAGSPAIDADYSSGAALDQRGFARPAGARNDIGAFEAGAQAPATVTSIAVTAAPGHIPVGGTDQFTATATYSDGATADVTAKAVWASDTASHASITGAGLASGVAEGTANITATLGGVTSGAFLLTVHTPVGLVVTNNRDDGSPGCLRTVLDGAGPGDTITFAPDVTGTILLTGGQLLIGQDQTITGPGATVLAVDGGGTSRLFYVSGVTATISGLTLKNGSDTDGGGIFNAGTLTVTGCALTGDTAQNFGGGIFSQSGATLTLANDTLSGDAATANYGGGVYSQGTLTATGCTFSGDTADYGGGLFSQGTMTLTNDTFSGDSGTTEGGGLYTEGPATVTSCTFAGDTAPSGSGGGIINWGTLTVTASLFSGSAGGDIANGDANTTSGGSNLLGDASPSAFRAAGAGDQFGVTDAMLGPLADNGGPTFTCAVLAGSPAIGGDLALPTTADQRGTARTAAQHTVGAFEYVAPAPLVPVARTHVLWNNADGRAMLWSLDAQGVATSHTFGPYADPTPQDKWTATALATGPDGKSHLVWNNTNGRVALWTVDDSGSFTLAGFGPYTDDSVGADPSANKWSAKAVSVGPDNVTHLLWDNTDHRMMLWNVDGAFNLLNYAGFGPYGDDAPASDPSRLWTATALATGPDNVSHVLWNDADGRVALWNMDSAFGFTLAGFGPYTDAGGAWSATAVSAGPDNVTHLLWGSTDHRMMLWNVDGAFNLLGAADFGPYADDAPLSDPSRLWTATALATGPDNVSHVLWNDADGRVALWDMNSAFGFTLAGFGPFADSPGDGAPVGAWTATAVSAPPGTPDL